MGKQRGKRRKERERHESPVLRLVRPEGEGVSDKHLSAGRPGETIADLPKPGASDASDGKEAVGSHVDSSPDGGGDDTPVIRSFNPEEANVLFNDPSVFPLVSNPGTEKFDLAPLIENPANVFLVVEGGGIFFHCQEPGIYEVHTAFLETFRGKNAIKASREAYRWMFTHTDCMTLLTRVPEINPAAERFCQFVGATKEFERKNIWQTKDGLVGMSFWSLRYDDWVRKTSELKGSGHAFHKRLLEEKTRLGRPEPLHDDEECHDIRVGVCAEMIYAGQVDKAVILYNRWARFSGYGLIALIAHNPIVIDIGEALLQITGNTFKVILVR